VQRVVALSSLRAAPPAEGVYGMSKALMEKIFCSYSRHSNTQFISVRLGNIAWAPDSVLNRWEQMLKRDGVIKSTGSGMSRYFITSEEMITFVKNVLFIDEQQRCLIIVPIIKLVPIEHLLELFTAKFGGRYELSESTIPEKKSDFFIGKSEMAYVKKIDIKGEMFYAITEEKQTSVVPEETIVTDGNQVMKDSEIINIINSH
jgi:FlaA1/EpsC-like NDP-sugar epimerase